MRYISSTMYNRINLFYTMEKINENKEDWEDKGTYWLALFPQRSPKWKFYRGRRLTASNFGGAAGHSSCKNPDEIGALLSGNESEEQKKKEDNESVKRGVRDEPKARLLYEEKNNVTVKEVGLAIPKWNNFIGASLDGEVGEDGCIEIKCPDNMYNGLITYLDGIKMGVPPTGNPPYDHIIWDHYDQMQGGMAITNKKWCDYVVYHPPSGYMYQERVPFDKNYWENELYPLLQKFINKWMK